MEDKELARLRKLLDERLRHDFQMLMQQEFGFALHEPFWKPVAPLPEPHAKKSVGDFVAKHTEPKLP